MHSIRFKITTSWLLSVLVVVSLVSFFSYKNASSILTKQIISQQLPITAETYLSNIRQILNQLIDTALVMSKDPYLVNFLQDPNQDEKVEEFGIYLDEIMNLIYAENVVVTSATTNKVYNQNVFFSILDKNDPTFAWYDGLVSKNDNFSVTTSLDNYKKNNSTGLFLNVKVEKDNEFLGTISLGVKAKDILSKLTTGTAKLQSSELVITDSNGLIRLQGDSTNATSLQELFPNDSAKLMTSFGTLLETKDAQGNNVALISKYMPDVGWYLISKIQKDTVLGVLDNLFISFFYIGFIGISFAIIISLLVLRPILRSIVQFKSGLSGFFAYLNQETQDFNLVRISSKDEFADMARDINQSIEKIRTNLIQDEQMLLNTQEVMKKVLKGNFEVTIQAEPQNKNLIVLQDSINEFLMEMADNIKRITGVLAIYAKNDFKPRLNDSSFEGDIKNLTQGINFLGEEIVKMLLVSLSQSEELHLKSNQLNEVAENMLQASTEQALSLTQTATSVEEINYSMNSMLQNSTQVISQTAAIRNIVDIISEIAEQTNLLALNAAIEAARAGDAGRGFAVVADEVRNLSARTTDSLSEIESSIKSLITSIDVMTHSVKEQTDSIAEISSTINQLEATTQSSVAIAESTRNISLEVKSIAENIITTAKNKSF